MPSNAGITQLGFSASRRNCLQQIAGLAAFACCDGTLLAAETSATPRRETFAKGLEHPWGLEFLPDGRLLVSERPGRMRLIATDGTPGAPLAGLPPVDARGQGGLLDVVLDPQHAENGLVYWSYAEAGTGTDAGRSGTAVARGRLAADRGRLDDVQVIFRQRPKVVGDQHYGSRLVFDREGMLFVTLGERHDYRNQAQNPMSHLGKVVRIRPDGGVPNDNPFVRKPDWLPEIWSLGHRNVQGAALHPGTGELWISEHGPQGGDEINIARRGRNYGWPIITYGCEYVTCAKIGEGTTKAGLEQPVAWWQGRSIAPAGIAFCSGRHFPEWRGNLLVGALAGEALWRLVVNGDRVESREPLPISLGERIRTVREGPDGWIYLLTDGRKGQVMRLVR